MGAGKKKGPSISLVPGAIGDAFETLTKLVTSPLGKALPIKAASRERIARSPGIEHVQGVDEAPTPKSIPIQCIDYGVTEYKVSHFDTVEELIAHPRPDWAVTRWMNIEGLNAYVINELRKKFDFHTLAAEDALNTPQRPKLEPYENHTAIIAHMVRMNDGSLSSEQVSFIVMKDILITFQEKQGDCWDPVRNRIQKSTSRFRRHSIWYLVYALLDAVIDNVFPILEQYGDALNALEEQAMNDPKPIIQQSIYVIKRELYALRRSIWPMRELTSKLSFDDTSPADKKVRTYMRDVHDHALQIIDLIESSREMTNSLQDFYISIVSNRMNEVMKALTIMASLFMPITFLAGLYGMNFEFIPELSWPYSYPTFLGVCVLCTISLLWYFKRNGWIGK
ncbi:magnesium/cobalt transporter CorA [Opitutaceae bacterium]|nr:magnesium/cobalt transporter CorA [Opitutaceae bacterium]